VRVRRPLPPGDRCHFGDGCCCGDRCRCYSATAAAVAPATADGCRSSDRCCSADRWLLRVVGELWPKLAAAQRVLRVRVARGVTSRRLLGAAPGLSRLRRSRAPSRAERPIHRR